MWVLHVALPNSSEFNGVARCMTNGRIPWPIFSRTASPDRKDFHPSTFGNLALLSFRYRTNGTWLLSLAKSKHGCDILSQLILLCTRNREESRSTQASYLGALRQDISAWRTIFARQPASQEWQNEASTNSGFGEHPDDSWHLESVLRRPICGSGDGNVP